MTSPGTRRRQATRKTLRQSLKDLLNRRRKQTIVQPDQVGSGILRRAATSIYLPQPLRVSLFPDFESDSQFDIDSYSISIPNHFASEVEVVDEVISSSPLASRLSLLPARSLSQFNLNQSYIEQERSFRPTQLTTILEAHTEGASRQASLISLHSVRPSRSTLRIRDSHQSLRSSCKSQSELLCPSTRSISRARSRGSSSDLRSLASFRTSLDDSPTATSPRDQNMHKRQIDRPASSGSPSIASIKHFGSFCVLDTYAPGCPVTATSEDLKYVFDVGEHFFLNNQECTDASMDIVTGFDADGHEVTHLVLFSPLISPGSGLSRFLLAALIDVTVFIRDVATVPELDVISEESMFDEGAVTPIHQQPDRHVQKRAKIRYELSFEDLLGGCYVDEASFPVTECGNIPRIGTNPDLKAGLAFDDIWTDLAHEETVRGRNTSKSHASTGSGSGDTTRKSSPSSSRVDSVLDSFMSELQQLYADFFLLAKSPLDAAFYEICNVSPSVCVSKDYVHGHLSHSSPHTIMRLSEQLGGEVAFDMTVRWGTNGDTKQLYCIPLFGQRDLTWICVLVSERLGALW